MDQEREEDAPSSTRKDEWDVLSDLTLSVMSNRNRYDKYKKKVANTSDTLIEQFSKEKAYYKERILAMTRDLFDERCENDDINRAHEEYLKSCIEYLKWSDITEMVEQDQRTEVKEDIQTARQELHKKIQETSVARTTDSRSPSPSPGPDPAPNPSPDPEDDERTSLIPHAVPAPSSAVSATSTFTGKIMSFANKMCIRKKTMDDFIVMKPIPGNSDQEINARLPKVRDYQNEIMKRASAASASHWD